MEHIRVQVSGEPPAADRFEHLLQDQLKRWLHKHIAVDMDKKSVGQLQEIRVRAADREQLVTAVAQAVAQYVAEFHEQDVIRSLIADEYGYDEPEELAEIEAYCWHNSDPLQEADHSADLERRKQQIAEEVAEYLNANHLLNVEGMVRFRLLRYTEHLRGIVEYAIDEYTADKQYEEFISLLKYFVYIQEAKIPAAHLIHKGAHEFDLLNEKMEPIETKQLDQFVVEMIDKEINYEDMIVSTLITVSPQHVYIHTRNPDMQVIRTIQQIFEDRAAVCTSCPLCRPLLGDYKRQDHSYR